jgi:hypothetical protein
VSSIRVAETVTLLGAGGRVKRVQDRHGGAGTKTAPMADSVPLHHSIWVTAAQRSS